MTDRTYTDKLKKSNPNQGVCNWNPDWYRNQHIDDVVQSQSMLNNGIISGGEVTDGGSKVIDIALVVAKVNGNTFTIAGDSYSLYNPVEGSTTWVYVNSVGEIILSTVPISGNFALLALVDLLSSAIQRIADLRNFLPEDVFSESYQKIIESPNVVSVFDYFIKDDSDEGAWVKRCQSFPWFFEELNTATRGKTKEFPAHVKIVVLISHIYIYDATDRSMPMWMVFSAHTSNIVRFGVASVSMKNGILCVGHNGAGGSDGMSYINFLKNTDVLFHVGAKYDYKGGIEERNSQLGYGSGYGSGLVQATVNHVDMTIIDSALIDLITEIAVPTIAVATDGGISVIDGPAGVDTVVNITQTTTQWYVDLTPDRLFMTSGSTEDLIEFGELPLVSSNSGVWRDGYYSGKTAYSPDLFLLGDTVTRIGGAQKATGSITGLTLIEENSVTPSEGSVAYITDVYNTGWMKGNIELSLSGENLIDKSVLATTVTDNGTATFSAVGTNTDLQAITATGGTITAPVTTGKYCYGWEQIAGDWLFRAAIADFVGISESGGLLTIADSTIFTLLRYTNTDPASDIEKFEYDEKKLFQEDAKSLLFSSLVQALDYDAATNQLLVGTFIGAYYFQGLVQTNYITDANSSLVLNNIKAVSAKHESYTIASISEVAGFITKINPRG